VDGPQTRGVPPPAPLRLSEIWDSQENTGPAMAQEDMVKAIVQDKYGSPDVLQLKGIDRPVVNDDEVLVRVHPAAVNIGDWHLMRVSVTRTARPSSSSPIVTFR
jgi:hypothetical protein